MTEHRRVTTGKYGCQPLGAKVERAVSSCVDPTVDDSQAANPSDSRFALKPPSPTISKRVRLTVHGTGKCTRGQVRPLIDLCWGQGEVAGCGGCGRSSRPRAIAAMPWKEL